MAKAPTMADLMASSDEHVVEQNTMIKGKVLSVKKNEILLDLGSYGIGQVPRREIGFGKSFAVGDEVVASVVEPEIPNGNVLLSLRKAAKEAGMKCKRLSTKAGLSPLPPMMLTVADC